MGVAEGDLTVGEALDAIIAERYAIDVAREVDSRVLAATDLLDVHGPRPGPDDRIDIAVKSRVLQCRTKLGAEGLREHVAGHEEAGVRGFHPGVAV